MVSTYMSESQVKNRPELHPNNKETNLARLIQIRRQIKARTPRFQRQESWRYKRIDGPWRKPKGIDSHMRLSVKGWPALVKVGYRVPSKVRGLHPSGLGDVLVHNIADLERISPEIEAARLAAGLGRKKKIELAKRAKELRIRLLNGRGLRRVSNVDKEEESKSGSKENVTK